MIGKGATLGSPAVAVSAPLISVIIPVFQGERHIVGAIRSALRQSYRNIEVIVVDDGSTDRTLARLETLCDSRLRVITQKNAGTAAARNLALSTARGEYVAFLDSDDRWFPNKLEIELMALQRSSSEVGMAYSSYFAVDDRGRLLNRAPRRNAAGKVLDDLLDGEDFLMPSVCLFDRRVFESVGVFNPRSYHEDHEFILRVAKQFSIVPTERRLVVYRQSTVGKCRIILENFERSRNEELATLEYLSDLLSEAEKARLHVNVLRSLAFRFLMYGFEENARRLIRELDVERLRVGKKGVIAWIFARTGINFMRMARIAIQSTHLLILQPSWNRYLVQSGLELCYE